MTTWNSMKDWAESDALVKNWAYSKWPTDEDTRATYVSHLRYLTRELKVDPKEFLMLLDGQPSQLTKNVRQHLERLAKTKNRKAGNERAALTSFLNFHNDRPQKFVLAVDIKRRKLWARPAWGLEEFQKILSYTYHPYRPALVLAAMAGQGRKEICYINEHLEEVQPVRGVPAAVQIQMPIRKEGEEGYTVVLPAQEWGEYMKNAPIRTTTGAIMHRIDLSHHVDAACKRAGIKVKGTGFHVLRSIYRTVGKSKPYPAVDPETLEQNMGHKERLGYDRSDRGIENIKSRAKAMIPYWEYFRRGGPPTVSKEELDERDKTVTALQNELTSLKKQVDEYLAGPEPDHDPEAEIPNDVE